MPPKRFEIRNPLLIMFKGPDGEIVTHLHPDEHTYREYGLLICDLVRHVARAFEVEEDDVWEYVDKERARPTTGITRPS